MKENGNINNHVNITNNHTSSNNHLLDILDQNYYIELGNVDLNVLGNLLRKKKLKLDDLFYKDIVTSGIGKISDDKEHDIEYQVNYLYSLHQKSSSSKICFTCGTIRYYDNLSIEKFAPIVLIPLSIDYRTQVIFMNGEPQINIKLLTLLKKKYQDKLSTYIDSWEKRKLTDVYSIDEACIEIAEKTGLKIGTVNYLTLIEVEYREFSLHESKFDPTKSIFETTDTVLMKDYFDKVLPILPTNIEQKYVTLKAHNGDSFVVNGRLGTGKTYTAVNIMADCIANNKKVLYVNQDLDNINDLRNYLAYLGLEPSVCKLTKNIWKSSKIETKQVTCYTPFNTGLISDLDDLSKIYDRKSHGYPYSYILEKIAILKESGIKETLPIETTLERHEIENLSRLLEEIEDALSKVRPFPNNPWATLLSSKNAPTIDEVIERTNNFYNCNKETMGLLNDVCDQYGLKRIENVRDFNNFNEELIIFSSVKPLSIWRDKNISEDTKKVLDEIRESADINYAALNMYKNITCEDYSKTQMDKVFKSLIKGHYYAESSSDESCLYIDRILEPNNDFENFINNINLLKENANSSFKELSYLFDFNVIEKDEYSLLVNLTNYMESNSPEVSWIDEYLTLNNTFGLYGEEYHSAIMKLKESSKAFIEYITPGEDPYTFVKKIISSENIFKSAKKKLNMPVFKKTKEIINNIVDEMKTFHESTKTIKKYFPKSSLSTVENWINYDNFLQLVTNLSKRQHKALVTAFSKCYHEHNIEIKELLARLRRFKECTDLQSEVENKFNYYNLTFNGHEFMEVVNSFTEILPYLNDVLKTKKKIYSYLPHNDVVTCKDIFGVISIDKDYQDVIMKQMRKKDKYEHLLGDAYKGFDTDVSSIYQAVDRFNTFYSRFIDKSVADKLLLGDEFNKLVEHVNYFTQLYTKWFQAFRLFSVCFFRGKMSMQDNTFSEISDIMYDYVKYINEAPFVYTIEADLEYFYSLKLKSIADDIQNGKLSKNLSKRFMLSVLTQFKESFYNDSFKGFDVEELKTLFGDLETSEQNLCDTNLYTLRNNQNPEKEKKRFIRFNDYNTILKYTDSQKKIFLADVSIINSDINLSFFDLVILDDVHLTTANKFYRLNEAKQVIVFGDTKFKSSITNTLIKRISNSGMITFHKRYIEMNNYFNNMWHWDNQYIYSTKVKNIILPLDDMEDFVSHIVYDYHKNKQIINVIVGSSFTRRDVYSLFIAVLTKNYSSEEALAILNSDIRIIDANGDSSRICDNVYIFSNDFIDVDEITANLVVRNYVNAESNVFLCYIKSRVEKENDLIENNIKEVIGEPAVRDCLTGGITSILFNRLNELGIVAEIGFGDLDLMIKTDKLNYGFMLLGKRALNSYSIFDDFAYYVSEYTKRNWKIDVIRMEDLEQDFEGTLKAIVQKVTN